MLEAMSEAMSIINIGFAMLYQTSDTKTQAMVVEIRRA